MSTNLGARRAAAITCLTLVLPAISMAQEADSPQKGPAWEEPYQPPKFVPWLVPNAQLQTWFTAYDGDDDPQADGGGYGDPEFDLGFRVPRARLGFRGGWKIVDFHLRFGTSRPFDAISQENVNEVNIVDAWARLNFESVAGTTRITIGQHFIPFSREMLMSSNDLVFQERAVSTNWLSPGRDVGATVEHTWRYLGVQAGVYNGGGGLMADDDPGVQAAARVDFHIGGDTYRTNSTHDAFGIGAAYTYEKEISQETQRVGVDLLGRIKGFTVQLEGQMNFLDPVDDPDVLPPGVPEVTRRMGGFAQISYYAETPLGDVEPAARFSYFDDATHLKDNGDVGVLNAGMNWREPVPFMDFGAMYIHRFEFAGAPKDNNEVRAFVGLKYPSRKFAPLNLVEVFRGLGAKPLTAPDNLGTRKGGKRNKAE